VDCGEVALEHAVPGVVGDLEIGARVVDSRAVDKHVNAAVLLNQARQVAELTGATREAGFLHRLAALEIDLIAFSAYYRHAAALHGERRAPFSMAPVIKIVGGELGQRASELLVEAAGGYGALADDMRVGNHVINPAAEMFEMRRVTVGSGAVEIQRNIIAKRVLGLPS